MVAQIYNPSPVRGGWGWGGRGWGAGQTGGFVTAGWPPAWLHGQQQTLSQGNKERLIVCWTPSSGFSTCKSTHTPHHTTTHTRQATALLVKEAYAYMNFIFKKKTLIYDLSDRMNDFIYLWKKTEAGSRLAFSFQFAGFTIPAKKVKSSPTFQSFESAASRSAHTTCQS